MDGREGGMDGEWVGGREGGWVGRSTLRKKSPTWIWPLSSAALPGSMPATRQPLAPCSRYKPMPQYGAARPSVARSGTDRMDAVRDRREGPAACCAGGGAGGGGGGGGAELAGARPSGCAGAGRVSKAARRSETLCAVAAAPAWASLACDEAAG